MLGKLVQSLPCFNPCQRPSFRFQISIKKVLCLQDSCWFPRWWKSTEQYCCCIIYMHSFTDNVGQDFFRTAKFRSNYARSSWPDKFFISNIQFGHLNWKLHKTVKITGILIVNFGFQSNSNLKQYLETTSGPPNVQLLCWTSTFDYQWRCSYVSLCQCTTSLLRCVHTTCARPMRSSSVCGCARL